MKGDARWNKSNKRIGRLYRTRGFVDARNVLNEKRRNKPKPPVLGSYMRTNTARDALMPPQIKKKIFSHPEESNNKTIQLSRDGNIIITSRSRNVSQMAENNMPQFSFGMFSRNRFQEERNEFQSSSSMDDLEQTAIEDVIDFDSLPQSYVNSKSLQSANLSRNSGMSRRLHTENFSHNSTMYRRLGTESFSRNPTTSRRLDTENISRNPDMNRRLGTESFSRNPTMSRRLETENTSRNPAMNRILDRKHTMVADEFSQYSSPSNKVSVSGLLYTVSRHDIMELFSNVGVIRSIEMGASGTAIVEFFREEDAIKACDIYHNRLLDGLPMKCYLKNDHSPHKFALSQRLGGQNEYTHYEQTYSDFSPVIFNARSRLNPRNVQFTVKLT